MLLSMFKVHFTFFTMAEVDDAANALRECKSNIEKEGIARSHGDTLEKQGISVDQFLTPSRDKDLKKIKYFSRINEKVKDNFLKFQVFRFDEPATFSRQGYIGHGYQWDKLLSDHIKNLKIASLTTGFSTMGFIHAIVSFIHAIVSGKPVEQELIETICDKIYEEFSIKFLESKFALFGFMRDSAAKGKKTPKSCLWQGEADAIAYSAALEKYVIVDFKVVDDLLDYWKKKTDLCGKHLHKCLVYAKLLQLHMNLHYLPPIMIVVIDRFTGRQGFLPLFEDYPKECKDKLEEYEWFTEQPPKPPLKMVKNDKLFHEKVYFGDVPSNVRLNQLFNESATVEDLLKVLGYDSRKLVSHLEE